MWRVEDCPILLVLTAYETVIWDVVIAPGAEIAAVVVTGYHAQAVANLPEGTPVGFSTYDDGEGADCPSHLYAYERGAEFSELDNAIRARFGSDIDHFYGAYKPECLPRGCASDDPPAASWSGDVRRRIRASSRVR